MPKTIRVETQYYGDRWQKQEMVVPELVSVATAAYPKTSAGAAVLLAAASLARQVQIVVTVTTAFADGDGTQPTFSIGEDGSATKFAATSVFTGASAGVTFAFAGTLTAGKALIVTAVAGTGATETGAITANVIGIAA